MEFYATAAQVIPTLFIAMVVAEGILAWKPGSDADVPPWAASSRAYFSVFVIGVMILGETCALTGLSLKLVAAPLVSGAWFGVMAGLIGVALPVVRVHWFRLVGWRAKFRAASIIVGTIAAMIAGWYAAASRS